jgi:anti-anti-sigma regulatory factor
MGLRVLLHAKKEMKQEGRNLVIKNMGASIREVFEMTGFLQLMVDEEKFVVVRKDDPADSKTVVLLFHGKMQSEHSLMLSAELVKIKEDYVLQHGHVTVILDMENLTFISPGAIKSLQQTLTETNWESRKIRIQNVSTDIRTALEKNGMGNML